jgi:hypothetical protein
LTSFISVPFLIIHLNHRASLVSLSKIMFSGCYQATPAAWVNLPRETDRGARMGGKH